MSLTDTFRFIYFCIELPDSIHWFQRFSFTCGLKGNWPRPLAAMFHDETNYFSYFKGNLMTIFPDCF